MADQSVEQMDAGLTIPGSRREFRSALEALQGDHAKRDDNPASHEVDGCERCVECMFTTDSVDCIKCNHCDSCESCTKCTHCSECRSCHNCNNCVDATDCADSSYLVMCNQCVDCSFCFGCVGLVDEDFCILNEHVGRERYFDVLEDLKSMMRVE